MGDLARGWLAERREEVFLPSTRHVHSLILFSDASNRDAEGNPGPMAFPPAAVSVQAVQKGSGQGATTSTRHTHTSGTAASWQGADARGGLAARRVGLPPALGARAAGDVMGDVLRGGAPHVNHDLQGSGPVPRRHPRSGGQRASRARPNFFTPTQTRGVPKQIRSCPGRDGQSVHDHPGWL